MDARCAMESPASCSASIRRHRMSAHDQLVEMMENYIAENKKFSEKKVKAAATRARAALQEIGKAVKERRKEIIEEKAAI